MAHIRDIDIDRLNIDDSLKPYIAEALIELDDLKVLKLEVEQQKNI